MDFLGARIQLNPRPAPQETAALEVAMLGHCPGTARSVRLTRLPDALDAIRAQGFGTRVDALIAGTETDLYHLPIPIHSVAEFDDIFPEARTIACQYRSLLAGDKAWLPRTVDDYFANGGRKLWVVRIPEVEGVDGFLASPGYRLHQPEGLRGLASVLVLQSVGLIALPDLERLQIPAQLADIPRKRLANPDPQFLPCGTVIDDGHRERRHSAELIHNHPVRALIPLVRDLLQPIVQHRPDIQCLFTMPLEYTTERASPGLDEMALRQLEEARHREGAHVLRQVQLLFPYLRDTLDYIHSPAGVIAGSIDTSVRFSGAWRSVAGTHLRSAGKPFPALSTQQIIALRRTPGLGILREQKGRLSLDDERLVVPALHRNDYAWGHWGERADAMRAGEVVRFMGYLIRQLRALGERLVFNLDPRDPRPGMVLEGFFLNLHRAGALRGRLPEDSFRIRQDASREATLAFSIEIAPTFPIDKIVLTFANRNGHWQAGVSHA